jgi:hypothetical protein
VGTTIAVEQTKSMDHGRCAVVCGDRRLWHILSNSHGLLGNGSRQRLRGQSGIRQRDIQRSVCTSPRGSLWHGQQRFCVELHNVDISRSEGDR